MLTQQNSTTPHKQLIKPLLQLISAGTTLLLVSQILP